MDQEIVDILNKVPRCVTRKVIKINNSLDLKFNHPSLGPNHTRKVDNTMQNIQEMTREDWDREIKNKNVFSSQKNKDESDHDFLVRLLEEIEGLTNGSWVLIDGGDIIVHLFDVETRSMYDLDNLWASQISPKDSIV